MLGMRSCLTLDPGGIQKASNNLKKVAAEKEKPCWRALGKLLPQVATWLSTAPSASSVK